MTPQSSFRRKIGYLVAIILLLGLLAELGRPGGILSEQRGKHKLSQSQLGQIDPTSETIKLATLGMRGIAANILWEKANRYKMKKDWTNLSATLEQITKLQPNFIAVWRFQAWNLSYNVSVEFDDFRDRYRWVIRGINFLKKGIQYNEREPRLLWDVGWFISQKIGRSDERKQFRRLFREDDAFHGGRPLALRDNWLVGKQWFLRAEALADEPGVTMKGMSPLIYRSDAPMCQMAYADALEDDGTFGEVARAAWRKGAREWYRYGERELVTSYGIPVRLNDLDDEKGVNLQKEIADLRQRLQELQPGLYEEIYERKLAQLTEEQRRALAIDPRERTAAEEQWADQARELLIITPKEIVAQVDPSKRQEGRRLEKQIAEKEQKAKIIRRYRHVVNFEYWRRRAEVEQEDETLAARKLVYQAEQNRLLDLEKAREDYLAALQAWRSVLDKHPDLVTDRTFGLDLLEMVDAYRWTLGKLDDDEALQQTYGKDFILRDVIELHEESP